MNREFLQLAQVYQSNRHTVGGWFASEKLDGMRAFWDGGITRRMLCSEVPFANTAKDRRLLKPPLATGLWSRYGKPIQAPDYWLDQLPPVCLDGELYLGRGSFQDLVSITKTLIPGPQWQDIKFYVFDAPEYQEVFGNGRINNPNFQKTFNDVTQWIMKRSTITTPRNFMANCDFIKTLDSGVIVAHNQIQLPLGEAKAKEMIQERLDQVIADGGEGLMLRAPYSFWVPKRTGTLLKVKGVMDSEAKVIGYVWGRKTDKESKFLGLMGAMIVDWNGVKFELSGFTDRERLILTAKGEDAYAIGRAHPGEEVCLDFQNPMFPRGSTVSFRYRELTKDGIPKEARYWRKNDGDT